MGRGTRQKAPMEFSKKILIFAAVLNIITVVFTFVMVWRTMDTSPLTVLIPAVAAETATGTGFYYSKARVENRIKLMKHYKVEPTESSFTENGGYFNG